MPECFKRLSGLLVGLVVCLPAYAGLSSGGGGEAQFPPEQIVRFSKKVERTLADKGAYVAIVARKGRPDSELPEGIHFTHAGFAVYSEIQTHDGRKLPGYAMYNLYQRDEKPDSSHLVQDFPVDFFSAVQSLEAGVIIPSPELQKRLLAVIGSPTYTALHNPHYSAIANPYTLPLANCTEYVLDVVNAAIYQTDDLRTIKAAEKKFFKAQPVNVNPIKLMLGSIFSAEIATSDQPGAPETATFETIAQYLLRYDAGAEVLMVRAED